MTLVDVEGSKHPGAPPLNTNQNDSDTANRPVQSFPRGSFCLFVSFPTFWRHNLAGSDGMLIDTGFPFCRDCKEEERRRRRRPARYTINTKIARSSGSSSLDIPTASFSQDCLSLFFAARQRPFFPPHYITFSRFYNSRNSTFSSR